MAQSERDRLDQRKLNGKLAMKEGVKKPIWSRFRVVLDVAGALALVALVAFAALTFHDLSRQMQGQKPEVDRMTPEKARFILNWGNLGDRTRIKRVLHSYRSSRSFTGDHVDACSLELDAFPEAVLREPQMQRVWSQGPVRERMLKEAVALACSAAATAGLPWFPAAEQVDSDRFYLSFCKIVAHHQSPSAVQLIAYDRKEQLLYYLSFKL